MNKEIKIGQLYRHYKGNHYEVIAVGRHSETPEELIGYRRREDGKVYFRPRTMIFETVKVGDAEVVRFTLVSDSSGTKNIWVEIYGWYGAIGLLAAYALSSFGILSPENVWYQIINITAALGIVVVSFYKRTYQPGVLNIVWAIIGLVALTKLFI